MNNETGYPNPERPALGTQIQDFQLLHTYTYS